MLIAVQHGLQLWPSLLSKLMYVQMLEPLWEVSALREAHA